jgi:hypothetical protein
VFAIGCAEASPDDDSASTEDALTNEGRDPIVDAARRAARIGEDATGYLGFVEADPQAELRAHVAHINIKRRALYTEISVRRGITVAEVAQATACVLFRERIAIGEAYRTVEGGTWTVRQSATPLVLPSFCR